MLVNNVVAYIFHFLSFFPHALLSFRTMYSPEQLSGCTRLEHSSYISITKTNWGSLSHFCSHLRSTLDARSDVVSHDNNVSSIKPLRSVWNKEQDRGERRYKKKKKKKDQYHHHTRKKSSHTNKCTANVFCVHIPFRSQRVLDAYASGKSPKHLRQLFAIAISARTIFMTTSMDFVNCVVLSAMFSAWNGIFGRKIQFRANVHLRSKAEQIILPLMKYHVDVINWFIELAKVKGSHKQMRVSCLFTRRMLLRCFTTSCFV